MVRFFAHVIPEFPHRGDRGTVYPVSANTAREALRTAKAEHTAEPEYRPSRDGRLIWTVTQ